MLGPDVVAVLDCVDDDVAILDARGRLSHANSAGARLFGFATPAALVAATPAEVAAHCTVFDEQGEAVSIAGLTFRRAKADGAAPEVPLRVQVVATGEERWVTVCATPLVTADGSHIEILVFGDVTDRVRADAELADSRRLAITMAAASPAILYVFDLVENRNVYVNDALPRLLGYTPERLFEAGTADLWALMHPDDVARWPEMRAQIAAAVDGEVIEQNFRLRHADGGWCSLTQRVMVLSRQPNGRPCLLVGAALDVTDLRETESALRESEARYRAVVDSQTEMICRYLPGTMALTFANDAYCRAVGRTKDELLGTSLLDLVPSSDRERVAAYFSSLAAAPRTAEIEHQVQLADGTVGYQHWVDLPIRDADGSVAEFQGIGRDVTALKRAEEDLRHLSGRLLSVQDEERRRLALGLHEQIAGTLVGLSLDVATARLRLGPQADREVVALLDNAEVLSQRVLQEIRTVSYVLYPPSLDGVGLAVALREFTAELARHGGVVVDFTGLDDLGTLPKEVEVALFRVAQEALTNVARHAGTDRATLELTTRTGEVMLRVADNGREMADMASTGDPERLGIGIAGMRARVRQLGGKLDISSDAGGTVVTAWLPRSERTDARGHQPRVASAGGDDRA